MHTGSGVIEYATDLDRKHIGDEKMVEAGTGNYRRVRVEVIQLQGAAFPNGMVVCYSNLAQMAADGREEMELAGVKLVEEEWQNMETPSISSMVEVDQSYESTHHLENERHFQRDHDGEGAAWHLADVVVVHTTTMLEAAAAVGAEQE